MNLHVSSLRVPVLGVIQIAGTAHGIVRIQLDDDEDRFRESLLAQYPDATIKRGAGATMEAGRAIRRYLAGGPDPKVDVVLPEDGFPVRVWREIARIPRGTVRSYARVARAIRRPQAARAVGQACGRNPLPLVIPCHRVVSSDRTLGGFTGGLDIKRKLLGLEGVVLRDGAASPRKR
jgi:O-6-methylguanine DNA methyltransferase